MVSNDLLKLTGCTPERLRQIYTCKDTDSKDWKIRKRHEDSMRSRIQDGMTTCLKNAKLYQAVDIAWDSSPIQQQNIPLLLWAQGKIKTESLIECFKQNNELVEKFCSKDDKGQIKVDLPRLYEVSINLIRSYVTRRLAAQTARFSNLWPFLKYEPFGTDEVAKLRGELVSQRVDVMTNEYNYRHLFPQSYRHMFLYSRAMLFPRSAWDVKRSWRLKPDNAKIANAEEKIESYVEREGLDFNLVHPSRYFWDRSAPLPNINTDNGPRWIGYYDITTYGSVLDGGYYNTDSISTNNTAIGGLITANGTYFNYYYDPKVLDFPKAEDPASGNDRRVGVGLYSAEERDKGCVFTEMFELVNPKAEGIGWLDQDVWLRRSIAGDGTIVAAEFMPSIPAVYGGVNENDDRIANTSMAMELMPFQDQLSNIFSQMLLNLKAGATQIWAIDKDALDPEMRKYVEDSLKGGKYYNEPQAWFYSGSKLRETGFSNPADNPRALLTIIQAQIQTTINDSMKAIGELLNMADRILVLSPNEIGQPNPREVSAREVTEISSTTNSISSFISDGIDEQRQAFKKLVFESLIAMSTQNFRLPAMNRYTKATIAKAGFEVPGDTATSDDNAIVPIKTVIVGRISDLMYDYYFDSRDGAERPVNSQAATALSQLVGQVLQDPEIKQAVGRKRMFEMLNEIFRLSGAGYDLKLEDGETEAMPQQAMPQPAPVAVNGPDPQTADRIAKIEALLMNAGLQGGAPAAPEAGGVPAALMPA